MSSLDKFVPKEKEAVLIEPGQWRGLLMAFDQSLSNTGIVLLGVTDKGIEVYEMLTFETDNTGSMGWEDNMTRAAAICDHVVGLLDEHGPDLLVHETPPFKDSPTMKRTDSSIAAATAIHCAAYGRVLVEMVSAMTVKKHLTGDYRAEKILVRNALIEKFGDLKAPGRRLNEHSYDALGIGVTFAELT